MAKIKARFRKYRGVPFAIEQFSGTQYRCRACNQVFLKKREFEKHVVREAENGDAKRPSSDCPQVGDNAHASVLYTRNIYDEMRQEFLSLSEGETYDADP